MSDNIKRKAAGGLIGAGIGASRLAAKAAKSKKLRDLIKKGVIKSGTKLKDLRKLMTKEKGKKKVIPSYKGIDKKVKGKKKVFSPTTHLKNVAKGLKEEARKRTRSTTTHLKNLAKGLTAKKRKGGTIKRKPAKKYKAGGSVRGVGIAKRGW